MLQETIDFVKHHKPACTKLPIYGHLANNYPLYAKLSKRSVKDFNENLFGKYCPKREICYDKCLGRPIPKYPEIEHLMINNPRITTGEYKGKEVWLFEAKFCGDCPLRSVCHDTCEAMDDFLQKDCSPDEPNFNKLVPINEEIEVNGEFLDVEASANQGKTRSDIPWHILSDKQKQIVKLRTLDLKDFDEISQIVGNNVKSVKVAFKRSIKKLKRAGKAIIKQDYQKNQFIVDFFEQGKGVKDIAKTHGVSERTVYRRLSNLFNPQSEQ